MSERDGIAASEDPKPLLRTLLAKRGAVSQFITADSLPKARTHGKGRSSGEDHAGHHALIDLLRSAGCFLRAFPAHGVDVGTLLVGIHTLAVSSGKQARAGFRTNLVACVAGTTEAYGYLPKGGWEVLGKATAGYMLSEPWPDKATAAASIRRAVEQLRVRHPGAGMVLFFDAVGNRRLFSCLADVGNGHPDPWMVEGNTAVVRVRSAFEELPRVAGRGGAGELAGADVACDIECLSADDDYRFGRPGSDLSREWFSGAGKESECTKNEPFHRDRCGSC